MLKARVPNPVPISRRATARRAVPEAIRRTSSSSSYATNSPGCADRSTGPNRAMTTGACSAPPSPPRSPAGSVRLARHTRHTASLAPPRSPALDPACAATGPTTDLGGAPTTRTRPGATDASTANSPVSTTDSPRPWSGRSSTTLASTQHPSEPPLRGRSSCARKPPWRDLPTVDTITPRRVRLLIDPAGHPFCLILANAP